MVKKLLQDPRRAGGTGRDRGARRVRWAGMATSRLRAQTVETHSVDFPIPFPVDAAEVTSLGLTGEAANALATQRAVERGTHLVSARYACTACHGQNFGGGVMVDAFPIGSLLAPNVTGGTGTRSAGYQPRDWDRIVRHGVLKDGHPSVMPSEDFQSMSDQGSPTSCPTSGRCLR